MKKITSLMVIILFTSVLVSVFPIEFSFDGVAEYFGEELILIGSDYLKDNIDVDIAGIDVGEQVTKAFKSLATTALNCYANGLGDIVGGIFSGGEGEDPFKKYFEALVDLIQREHEKTRAAIAEFKDWANRVLVENGFEISYRTASTMLGDWNQLLLQEKMTADLTPVWNIKASLTELIHQLTFIDNPKKRVEWLQYTTIVMSLMMECLEETAMCTVFLSEYEPVMSTTGQSVDDWWNNDADQEAITIRIGELTADWQAEILDSYLDYIAGMADGTLSNGIPGYSDLAFMRDKAFLPETFGDDEPALENWDRSGFDTTYPDYDYYFKREFADAWTDDGIDNFTYSEIREEYKNESDQDAHRFFVYTEGTYIIGGNFIQESTGSFDGRTEIFKSENVDSVTGAWRKHRERALAAFYVNYYGPVQILLDIWWANAHPDGSLRPRNGFDESLAGIWELKIASPTTELPANTGDLDDPGKIMVNLSGPMMSGLDETWFSVKIDGTPAEVVSGMEVGNQFWLVVQPEDKIGSSPGSYDLEVTCRLGGGYTAVMQDAVYYAASGIPVNLMLVGDVSGSMQDDSKLYSAQNAARLFIDHAGADDKLGIVSFESDSNLDFPLTQMTTGNPDLAKVEVDDWVAAGSTALGAGLDEAMDELVGSNTDSQWRMVVLSDGKANVPTTWTWSSSSQRGRILGSSRTVNVDTVSVGSDAAQEVSEEMAKDTGGVNYSANLATTSSSSSGFSSSLALPSTSSPGIFPSWTSLSTSLSTSGVLAPTSALTSRLADIYKSFAENARLEQRIGDWEGTITTTGEADSYTVTLENGLPEVIFTLSWNNRNRDLEFYINGVKAENTGYEVKIDATHTQCRVIKPAPGEWTLTVVGAPIYVVNRHYKLMVSARSHTMLLPVIGSPGDEYTDGDEFPVVVYMGDDDPITDGDIKVVVRNTDGDEEEKDLYDDGEHGDGKAGDGFYGNTFTVPDGDGALEVTIEGEGTNGDGDPIDRKITKIVDIRKKIDMPAGIYAEENLTIGENAVVAADRVVGGLYTDLGTSARIVGNLEVAGSVDMGENSLIEGDVTCYGTANLLPGATITGSLNDNTYVHIGFITAQPVIYGTTDLSVSSYALTEIWFPGDYRDCDVQDNSSVRLTAGTYNMRSLAIGENAWFVLDITDGEIIINIDTNFSVADSANVRSKDHEKVLFYTNTSGTASIGENSVLPASLIAPYGTVQVSEGASVRNVAGENIIIGPEAGVMTFDAPEVEEIVEPEPNNGIISGNLYKIVNANSGKLMDLSKPSSDEGQNVHQWENVDAANQLWTVTYNEDGAYILESEFSEKFLDVADESKIDGANIQQGLYRASDAQRFKINLLANGKYIIENVNSGKVVEVENGSLENEANIRQWSYTGTAGQQWIFEDVTPVETIISGNIYKITNVHSGKAMDVSGPTTDDMQNVHQWDYADAANQLWKVLKIDNNCYELTSLFSGKALDVDAASPDDGGNIQQYTRNWTAAQRFHLVSLGGGKYTIQNLNSGKVVEAADWSTENGGNIQQWSARGYTSQQWIFEDKTPTGRIISGHTYKITNVHSGKVMDLSGPSFDDGANIHQWTYSGNTNQQWKVIGVGNNVYKLESPYSGKVLDVAGMSQDEGANIQQWSWSGTDAQKFLLVFMEGDKYIIQNLNSGKVVEVADWNTADDGNIQQWTPKGYATQQWIFEDLTP